MAKSVLTDNDEVLTDNDEVLTLDASRGTSKETVYGWVNMEIWNSLSETVASF